MKPTQQETLWVALRAGMDVQVDNLHRREPYWTATMSELQKLIELALERFGAGGGEPVLAAVFDENLGRPKLVEGCPELYHGQKLYTHPSHADLRAEYLRGLEEGFKEGWIECSKWAQRDDLIADIGSPSYEACVSAVKALKGKQ